MKRISSISDSDYSSDEDCYDITDYESDSDTFVKELVLALTKEPDITNIYVTKYSPKIKIHGNTKYYTEKDKKDAINKSKNEYMLSKSWFCEIYKNNMDYTLAGKCTHLKSKKHKKNSENIYFLEVKFK